MIRTDRLSLAISWLEADMVALYQRHNNGTLPSPEKVQEMMATLSDAQFERLIVAKLEEMKGKP